MKKLFIVMAMLIPAIYLSEKSKTVIAADIPKDCRVGNVPGYCCWASLETLGKFHKISSLNGLLETRVRECDAITIQGSVRKVELKYGYDHAIRKKLIDLKVRFWMNTTGNADRSLLRYANSHGCLVGLNAGARGQFGHGIVLTYYDDKIIRFYDSNQPDDTWEGSREWFDFWWSGLIVVVDK